MNKKQYEIRIDGLFESAHYLYDYFGPGKNEPLHGHSYQAELYIGSNILKNGISVDFMDVRTHFDELITALDHTCLNAHAPFDKINPTAENIAVYFHEKLSGKLPENSRITRVTVWEGPRNHATYYPE